MHPLLRLLIVLLLVGLVVGFFAGMFLIPSFGNWVIAAAIACFGGWLVYWLLHFILHVFALGFDDDGSGAVLTGVKIFAIIVGVAAAIFFTFIVRPYIGIF